jgi:hypothetical protein
VKKQIDWEAIEREYRAGQLSIREIARQNDISDASIRKKAKKEGWERDLSEKIRQKTNNELVRIEVRDQMRTSNTREIIEEAAARGVEVVRSHRKMISRLLEIGGNIMQELENEYKPNNETPLLDARSKADLYRSLGQVMAKVIPLERQAFNLDAKETEKNQVSGKIVIETQRAAIREQLKNNPKLAEKLKNAIHYQE